MLVIPNSSQLVMILRLNSTALLLMSDWICQRKKLLAETTRTLPLFATQALHDVSFVEGIRLW